MCYAILQLDVMDFYFLKVLLGSSEERVFFSQES